MAPFGQIDLKANRKNRQEQALVLALGDFFDTKQQWWLILLIDELVVQYAVFFLG